MSEIFNIDDVHTIDHHPVISELAEVLSIKTNNNDVSFFRMEVAYFICKLATCMQAHIVIPNTLDIPVNAYVLALSKSGAGKGTSVGIIENEILNGFRERYINDTFPAIASKNLDRLANAKAIRTNADPADCLAGLGKRFEELGSFNFTFDDATTPAIKQYRELLNLAGTGAINISIDEIGSNLLGIDDVMRTFMELYDKGHTNAKLVKNSKDNQRGADFNNPTPANLLLFGTQDKLLSGGAEETALYSWLREGYGRRLLFGYGNPVIDEYSIDDAEKLYDKRTNPKGEKIKKKWHDIFINLADEMNNKFQIDVPRDIGILYTGYQIFCNNRANDIPDYRDIEQVEMRHRHFKALKLAGALAFIDNSPMLTKEQLYQAIKLVEEDNGTAFSKLMQRDPTYVKLAKYICTCGKEVTHADLTEALPFYKTGSGTRKEQMALARAYGATHNLLIKVETRDNIEFFSGETLKENDLKNCIISCSFDFAYDYTNSYEKWEDLCTTLPRAHKSDSNAPMSFINHHLLDGDPDMNGQGHGHRQDSSCLDEFNMVVLDIDGSTTMDIVADLFADYTWLMYSTKSADPILLDRFRIIFPLSHNLKLTGKDYKEFMNNIMNWFPFPSDEGANQQSRKWNCNTNAKVYANDGKLLNVLPFIPHTSVNDSYNDKCKNISDMGALEKWFLNEINDGAGRNNSLYRYAAILKDNSYNLADIKDRVTDLNSKLQLPLSERELSDTIFKSLANKF